jgi:AcrR family transcriptional regulator
MTRSDGRKTDASISSRRKTARRRAPASRRARISRPRSGAPKTRSAELPRKAPRQSRAQETVKAILQAAAETIAEHGFAATTTNKIAERAGVSIGSLYQYFPNKTAILVRLLEEHVSGVKPVIDQSLLEFRDPRMPFAVAMRRLFLRLIEAHKVNPRLNRVLAEEVPHPAHIKVLDQRQDEIYVGQIKDILRRRGDVGVKDPTAAAHVLVQATGALSRWLIHSAPERLDREAYIDEAVQLLSAYALGGSETTDKRRPARPLKNGRV